MGVVESEEDELEDCVEAEVADEAEDGPPSAGLLETGAGVQPEIDSAAAKVTQAGNGLNGTSDAVLGRWEIGDSRAHARRSSGWAKQSVELRIERRWRARGSALGEAQVRRWVFLCGISRASRGAANE